MSRPRTAGPIAGWLTGTAVAALSLLALVFVLGGQALDEQPPGLPDLRLPSTALIVSRWVAHIVAVAAVGLALLGSGVLGARRPDATAAVVPLGFVWASASVFGAAFTSWQLGSAELLDSLQVRGLLVQGALAALGALVAAAGSRWALAVLLLALVPPLVTGHVLTAGSPLLAGAALVVHVIAAALWVGGLSALAWLAVRGRSSWAVALPTYSRLAVGCVIALALSGVVSTLTRTTSVGDLLTTTYGTVVLLKATLLGGLAAVGWLQRERVATAGRAEVRAFVLLAGAELAMMALAFALATGLAHTPPPT